MIPQGPAGLLAGPAFGKYGPGRVSAESP